MSRIIFKAALLALIISFAATRPALTYIDPNTGAYVFRRTERTIVDLL